MQNGKGDQYRPVERTKWEQSWERIFAKLRKSKKKRRKK